MTRLDLYVLRSMLGPFGFFALVFTGILWLLQSLRLIEAVITNGQGPQIFLEFSALVLPNVMIFVLPLASFAAALYTINRLYIESELVVMLMSGRSPWSLAKPLLIFGAIIGVAATVVSLYLYPLSTTRLGNRMLDIQVAHTNSFIDAGRFRHPAERVTFFVEETNEDNEMVGLFLNDERDLAKPVTHSANRAVLVEDDGRPLIVMFDGETQRMDLVNESFSTVKFTRLAYDVSGFLKDPRYRKRSAREYFLLEGLNPDAKMLKHQSLGRYISEAHDKIVTPLLTLTLPLLALGGIMSSKFRRGSFGRRMTVSVGLLILVLLLQMGSKSWVKATPDLWPLAYLPVIAALGVGSALIAWASRVARRPT